MLILYVYFKYGFLHIRTARSDIIFIWEFCCSNIIFKET